MKYNVDKKMILSLASNADVYRRGEVYCNQSRVRLLPAVLNGDNEILKAHVQGQDDEYMVSLTFDDDGHLKRYSCDCPASTMWRGCCKHVVAALLSILYAGSRIALQNRQDRIAEGITDIFEKKFRHTLENTLHSQLSLVPSPAEKAVLWPSISINSRQHITLHLKVGFNRLYVVKNIKQLIMRIQSGQTAEYGKGLSFKHSLSAFDSTSQTLISALTDFYRNIEQMDRLNGHLSTLNSGDIFVMSHQLLDTFFSIYKGQAFPMDVRPLKVHSKQIMLDLSPPPVSFALTFNEEKVVQVSGDGTAYYAFPGEKYLYFYAQGFMYAMDKPDGECVDSLMEAVDALHPAPLTFSGSRYTKFLSYIYPMLKEKGFLREDSQAPPAAQTSPLVVKLYLDTAGRTVVCQVLFCYGEIEINPLLPMQAEVMRDLLQEARLLAGLEAAGFSENPATGQYELHQEEQIFNFYQTGLGGLESQTHIQLFATDSFKKRQLKPTAKASFGIRLEGHLLAVQLEGWQYPMSELLETLESYKLKKRYHRLKDGSFVNLEDANIEAYARTLSALDLTKKDVAELHTDNVLMLPAHRALYVNDVLPSDAQVKRDANFKALVSDLTKYSKLPIPTPKGLNGTLRPYQQAGFKWLKTLDKYGFSGILADEMGLGKTLQVITLLLAQQEEPEGERLPSLVVTPNSLMYNWAHEIDTFAPSLRVTMVCGTPSERKDRLTQSPGTDVFITTYDLLKRDITHYQPMAFRYVVADEAQYIKNAATQNALALKKIHSHSRFALTGTPIENTLAELWSIFDFLMPGYLFNAGRFNKLYETPIVKDGDQERASLLQKQLSPFILRRLKSDVLQDLPEKIETTLFAEMEPEQQKIYQAHLLLARGELMADEAGNQPNRIQVLAHLTRLRQICAHPATFMENYKGSSGKLDLTMETLASAVSSGHRVLVFSQFTSMLAILREQLQKAGIPYFYLDGATDSKTRLDMAKAFNAGENDAFLISLKAGGTGLNLTGANVVIHYDQWWNPAVMNQATDRTHRIGQTQRVQVIHMITKGTIEEKILALQKQKKDLADAVLAQDVNAMGHLSADELLALIQQD